MLVIGDAHLARFTFSTDPSTIVKLGIVLYYIHRLMLDNV